MTLVTIELSIISLLVIDFIDFMYINNCIKTNILR